MLNWQEKTWVKVIAMTLVITFLAYDIAWSMDFSPFNISHNRPAVTGPGLFSKIGSFISKTILYRHR